MDGVLADVTRRTGDHTYRAVLHRREVSYEFIQD
jgi:hypothetical protein